MTTSVAVLGAGAWGTALAAHLARRDDVRVTLWARDAASATQIAHARRNERYLPGVALSEALSVSADFAAAARADLLIGATPIAALPEISPTSWPRRRARAARLVVEGIRRGSGRRCRRAALAHQVLAPRWPAPVGVVSGPSFAEEVARGLPTAVAVAATDPALAAEVASLLRADTLRAYESDDLAGVEVGGAVKNVLAIAAGASDGLGFGHNARAALITRGLAETGRLSGVLGGRRETLMGLAGLGDLVLTCTGDLSRNRRVGLALARGRALPQILAELGHVAEGVAAARPAARARASITRSRCRSPTPCIASCTKNCRRATRSSRSCGASRGRKRDESSR